MIIDLEVIVLLLFIIITMLVTILFTNGFYVEFKPKNRLEKKKESKIIKILRLID